MLPCQAVFQHGEKHYCLTMDEHGWHAHEIEIGPDNGKHVVIRGGLEDGRRVVLATESNRDKVVLPELAQGD